MKKKILLTDILLESFIPIFKKNFSVDTLWNKKKKIYSDYYALVVSGLFKIPQQFYEKLSNLKIISVFGVGFDNVNLNACKKKNIVVANTPGVLTRDVADLALTFVLSISRNLFNAQQYVISKDWKKKGPMQLTDSVYNKKIGIVGLGKIGKEFAKKAKVFSTEICYFGPSKKNIKYKYFNNLKRMAKYVDYLVITCPGGSKTNNLISFKILKEMKKSAYLINVSRGSVIDEEALLKCLKNKTIKGAALDVYKNEPKINQKFRTLNNVILHPHHGSGTYETRKSMAELSSNNIQNYFKTGKPLHKVNL